MFVGGLVTTVLLLAANYIASYEVEKQTSSDQHLLAQKSAERLSRLTALAHTVVLRERTNKKIAERMALAAETRQTQDRHDKDKSIPIPHQFGRVLHWDESSCGLDQQCRARYAFESQQHLDQKTRYTSDAMNCSRVYDVTCDHEYYGSFFHLVADCIVPAFGVLNAMGLAEGRRRASSSDGLACLVLTKVNPNTDSPDWLRQIIIREHPHKKLKRFVQTILAAAHQVLPPMYRIIYDDRPYHRTPTVIDGKPFGNPAYMGPPLHQLHNGTSITTWSGFLRTQKHQMLDRWPGCHSFEQTNVAQMSNVAASLAMLPNMKIGGISAVQKLWGEDVQKEADRHLQDGQQSSHKQLRVVLICRLGSRNFLDCNSIHQYLVRHRYTNQVLIYWGNETLVYTFALFKMADAVIGFHGAGLVQTLFSRTGIVVVDLRFSCPPDSLTGFVSQTDLDWKQVFECHDYLPTFPLTA